MTSGEVGPGSEASGPRGAQGARDTADRSPGRGHAPGAAGALDLPARWLATGLGSGYLWPAPGTWGSLLGLVAFAVLLAPAGPAVQVAACVAVTVGGVWASHVTATKLGEEDPSRVVVDEVAGMWIALVGIVSTPPWTGWVLAFLAFRVLDIVKPFPARRLEGLPGGVGIMADDVVAGLYAQVVVRLVLAWWVP